VPSMQRAMGAGAACRPARAARAARESRQILVT